MNPEFPSIQHAPLISKFVRRHPRVDVERYLPSGRLVQLLKGCASPDADLYAVHGRQHRSSVRVKALMDFVAAAFTDRAEPGAAG